MSSTCQTTKLSNHSSTYSSTHSISFALFLIALLFSIIITIPNAYAMVDLLNPQINTITNNTNLLFEYYVTMPNLTACTLNVGGNLFPDIDVQSNAINNVQVNAIADGAYNWSVSCSNESDNTSSLQRSLVIDATPPTIAVVSPQTNTLYKTIPVDFIPFDGVAELLTCTITWKNETLDIVSAPKNIHFTKEYSGSTGNGTLNITCADGAGNTVEQDRQITYIPDYGLFLTMEKPNYGITESARVTINTITGANVSLDICPDQSGFVACSTAILASSDYPQTITLPYLNKTGSYLVEATARFAGQTKINRTKYNITNSMFIEISSSKPPRLNVTVNLTARPAGGVGPYRVNWVLQNGTILQNTALVSVLHTQPGTYTHIITAYDSANNSVTTTYAYTIKTPVSVIVKLTDAQTGQPIVDADVSTEADGLSLKTKSISTGLAYIELSPGDYTLFATAQGYKYNLLDVTVATSSNPIYEIKLQKDTSTLPVVTVISPTNGSVVNTPQLQFNVQYGSQVTCTLYTSTDNSWFSAGQTIDVVDTSTKLFSPTLAAGKHMMRVECVDKTTNKVGTSNTVEITMQSGASATGSTGTTASSATSTAPTAAELKLQDYIDAVDAQLNGLDSYSQKEKEAVSILGFDRQLRNVKRALQQAVRDMSDLQFRQDLDEPARTTEQTKIMDNVRSLLASTPQSIVVKDSKSYVRYIEQKDVSFVSSELAGIGGFSTDSGVIAKSLLKDQQKFTVSTKVMQVDYVFTNGDVKSVTVVNRVFTYAPNLSQEYSVYEILPQETVKTVNDLTLNTKGQILKDDIIKFEQEKSVTYIIPKRVDFTRVEDIKTVLARPYVEQSLITGFAIFGVGDINASNMPIILIMLALIILYLAYYFDLIKHLQFLYYRIGKKGKFHYVSVMINDANDQLSASNYDKADMLFKEIRLTYDSLPLYARNELYEEVMGLLKRMDTYYFNIVMLEFDGHLKAHDLESAIASYEKLTSVYGRLDIAEQEQLASTIAALASRLGVKG